MKLVAIVLTVLAFSGCASSKLMKDCKQQGDSQYFHCKTASTNL